MEKSKIYLHCFLPVFIISALVYAGLLSCDRHKEFDSKTAKNRKIKFERKYYLLDSSKVTVNQIFKNIILPDSLLSSLCIGFELNNIDNYYSYKETIRPSGSYSEIYRYECSIPYLDDRENNYDFIIEYPPLQFKNIFNILINVRKVNNKYKAAFIAWNNRKNTAEINGETVYSSAPPIYGWDIGNSTVTIVTNIPYQNIKNIYPKFSGTYIYEQVNKIYFDNNYSIDKKDYYNNIKIILKSINLRNEYEKKYRSLDTINENTSIPIKE